MIKESKKQQKQKARNAIKHTKKAMKMLNDYDGVAVTDSPSLCLFIGNGGMLCGVNRESLLTSAEEYGSVVDLVMLPKKSFALIKYGSQESSRNALHSLEGHVVANDNALQSASPFYVKYLDTETLDFAKGEISGDVVYPHEGGEQQQEELFVEGLECHRDFVCEDYERTLYQFFHTKCQLEKSKENTLKHRSVLHYGYQFLYGSNNIDKDKPLKDGIPDICKPLLEKLVNRGIMKTYPDQLTVNQYEPGQGIPPHIDTHSAFEDGILSLTLNSQVCMDFNRPDGKTSPILLPQRSLLVMKGGSRYLWTHGITPRKFDIVYCNESDGDTNHLTLRERGIRISLTFRKIMREPCRCPFAAKCDSQSQDTSQKNYELPSSENEASKLEQELVYSVYDNIAEHFSDTRHSPWPKVKAFLCGIEAGSLVADVGCGNGKYLGVNKELLMMGSDRSVNLVAICEERGHQVIVSDCLTLPYRSNCFDAAICIAVIHHLSTEQRRLDAINELLRIVRIGGRVLIYVWALEQDVKEGEETESLLPKEEESACSDEKPAVKDGVKAGSLSEKELDNRPVQDGCGEPNKQYIQLQEGRNTFQQQDLLVPWHLKNKDKKDEHVYHRFYHVFKEGELKELCSRIPNAVLENLYLDCGNWCIILQKIK